EVWWSLANLKTHRFDAADMATMRAQLARTDLRDDDRLHLEFALGKALEDERDFGASFEAYGRGNAIRKAQLRHSADDTHDHAELTADEARALGEEYLERTRIQRRTARPFFIDKLPNNWLHVGLIQLILPNATIVDARRHPLGCCLSGYKQHFARGQAFSYDL